MLISLKKFLNMPFKKILLFCLLSFIASCTTTSIKINTDSQKIEGKFSMFSEDTYISGKISLTNQKDISQIKINLKRYPKTFLITEIREGDQKKYKNNFNESYEENIVKNLIEEISIYTFSNWLMETCILLECNKFETQNILVTKKELYESKKIKKVVGSYKDFKFAIVFKL